MQQHVCLLSRPSSEAARVATRETRPLGTCSVIYTVHVSSGRVLPKNFEIFALVCCLCKRATKAAGRAPHRITSHLSASVCLCTMRHAAGRLLPKAARKKKDECLRGQSLVFIRVASWGRGSCANGLGAQGPDMRAVKMCAMRKKRALSVCMCACGAFTQCRPPQSLKCL